MSAPGGAARRDTRQPSPSSRRADLPGGAPPPPVSAPSARPHRAAWRCLLGALLVAGALLGVTGEAAAQTTAPSAPTNLRATEGHHAVKLEWDAPSDDGGSAITRYAIAAIPSVGPAVVLSTSSAATSTVLTALLDDTYSFRVQAISGVHPNEGFGAASADLTGVTVGPATVTIAGAGGVYEGVPAVFTLRTSKPVLSTTKPLDVDVAVSETGGDMVTASNEGTKTVSFALDTTTATLSVPTRDDGAHEDSVVTAAIQTDSDYTTGADASATVSVADATTTPSAPTNLRVVAHGHKGVRLAWDAPEHDGGAPIEQYEITITHPALPGFPSFDSDFRTLSADTSAVTTSSYVGTHEFRVRAINENRSPGNRGPFSTRLTGVTMGPATITIEGAGAVEEGAPAVFTLTASKPLLPAGVTTPYSLDVHVAVSETGGDIVAGSDERTWTVSFGYETTTATLSVPTADDGVHEETSMVTGAILQRRASFDRYTIGTPSSATVSVADATDPPSVPVFLRVAAEGHKAVRLEWNAPSDDGGSPIIEYEVEVTSGQSPAASFPTNSLSTSYVVVTVSDGTRDFRVRAVNAAGAGGWSNQRTGVTVGPATVTIASEGGVYEGISAVFTLTASKPVLSTSKPLTVDVAVSETGGDMVGSGDEGAKTVKFDVDALTAALTVPTADDAPQEVDSVVTAAIQMSSVYTTGTPSSATVNVVDDDSGVQALQVVTVAVEGPGEIIERVASTDPHPRFRVSRDAARGTPLTVSLAIDEVSDTRTDLGPDIVPSDFVAAAGEGTKTVTIPAGAASAVYEVEVEYNDLTFEQHGAVRATLAAGAGYTVGSADSASVRVLDNDQPVDVRPLYADGTPAFSGGTLPEFRVGEGDGHVELQVECVTRYDRVVRNGASGRGNHDLAIALTTQGADPFVPDRTVTADQFGDFAYTAEFLSCNPGGDGSAFTRVRRDGRWIYRNVLSARVPILDDDVLEPDETFFIRLQRHSGSPGFLIPHEFSCPSCGGRDASHLVTIVDNEVAGTTGLRAEVVPGAGITLFWDPPTEGGPVAHYLYRIGANEPWRPAEVHPSKSPPLYQFVTGLVPGVEAELSVRTVFVSGQTSVPDSVTVTGPRMDVVAPGGPSAPRHLAASRVESGTGEARLTWDAPISEGAFPINGYQWRATGGSFDTDPELRHQWLSLAVDAGGTSAVITGIEGETHEIWVRAVNFRGGGSSDSVTLPGVGAGKPTGLSAANGPGGTVELSWTAPSVRPETIDAYMVSVQALPLDPFGSVRWDAPPGGPDASAATATSRTLSGLEAGTRYIFRVRGWSNALGFFEPSDPLNFTTGAQSLPATVVLGAPGSVSATAAGASRIDVLWLATAGATAGYEVERSATGTDGWTAVDPAHAGTGTEYADTGLAAETTYHYRVRGVSADGPGPWSAPVSAATLAPGPVTGADALTAAFEGMPAGHDGTTPFTFALVFGEAPTVGYRTLRDHAFAVTGGTVRSAKRRTPGSNLAWDVTVAPSGHGEMTVTLPPTADCAATGAICTADGRGLSVGLSTIVLAPVAAPLTAAFEAMPAGHDGTTPFSFGLVFSEAPEVGYRTLRDHAFTVTGGTVRKAKRRTPGSNLAWDVTVAPSGHGEVTVSLLGTADCAATGAICTADGRGLSVALSAAVSGLALSVADARAEEGRDASVEFEVSLSRAAAAAVTVDYATSDGSASAGSDYKAVSGTLSFAAGETEKTVSVPVFDDAIDEGEETFALTLSNATGALIADATATGTISNSDPLQKMWLSRFGRTVAGHVTEAVAERLASSPGSHATLAGQRVELADRSRRGPGGAGVPVPVKGAHGESEAGLEALSSRLRHGTEEGASASSRTMTGREVLLGSSFHLAGGGAEGAGPGLAAWGRVTAGGFSGEDDAESGRVRIEGDTVTGIVGADAQWNRLLAGVAVSLSEADGTFRYSAVSGGTVESELAAVSPYARLSVSERVSVWGLAGYGEGEMTMVEAARDGRDETTTKTDISMRLGALGVRGALLRATESGGLDLAVKADGFVVETEWEAVSEERDRSAGSSRLRVALDGSRSFALGGGVLTPGLELGVRHDGGDAETGTGIEAGGRIAWTDPSTGLSVAANARWLAAHEEASYDEWGASASVRLDPDASGRGLSFSLAPVWGAASGGVEGLWSVHDAGALAADRDFEATQRIEAQAGYGLAGPGGVGVLTPNAGVSLAEGGGRAWRAGARWSLGANASLDLDGTRTEAANDDDAEHALGLRVRLRW